MSEEMLGHFQHYTTREGRVLRFARRRCRGCGQPHSRLALYQAQAEEEREGFVKPFLTFAFVIVALVALTWTAVGYFPVHP